MQYDVATPQEYFAALAPDWRRDTLMQLRALIREKTPDWAETISYKMLAYGPAGAPMLHLNAQKHYVALYVGDVARIDPTGEILAQIDHGKSCLRFKRRNVVADSGVAAFLDRYIALKKAGADLGC